MFNWFTKKTPEPNVTPLKVDIHSHLLPNLDDGVQSFEQATEIIIAFKHLGYEKIITSPHVMSDAYRNTTAMIQGRLADLNAHLKSKSIDITVETAAEYYLDENLMEMLTSDTPLLSFGKKYLLFETNFLTAPFNLKDFIFVASTKGYKPVLAHPERYLYLQNNLDKAQDLLDRGVLFQMNASSVTGYYSKQVQAAAFKLIDKGMVHFMGSDCHHLQHYKLLEQAQGMKYYRKALSLPLLNNSL